MRRSRCAFVAACTLAFAVPGWTQSAARLDYSTFLGGAEDDEAYAVAVDRAGNTYVAGGTESLGVTVDRHRVAHSSERAVVTKLDPAGRVVYRTTIGGTEGDEAYAMAVDEAGSVYIAGSTRSADFPIVRGLQPKFGGITDGFLAKLDASGNLVYSTFIGGSGVDVVYGLAIDAAGNAYLAGETTSTDFPVVNAVQPRHGGFWDAFVCKVNATGSALLYSTYLGGKENDLGFGVAVDAAGNAYVAGATMSSDFPLQNPLGGSPRGGFDAFVVQINPFGSAMVSSWLFGGSGSDFASAVAVDATGAIYVSGSTESSDFQTTDGPGVKPGGWNAFVAKMSPMHSIVYARLFGGSGDDYAYALALDPGGGVWISGATSSKDLPTRNAIQTENAGGYDAFVTLLGADGRDVIASTYLGGRYDDLGHGVAVGSSGEVIVTGQTMSFDFPSRHAFQAGYGGEVDVFISRIAF